MDVKTHAHTHLIQIVNELSNHKLSNCKFFFIHNVWIGQSSDHWLERQIGPIYAVYVRYTNPLHRTRNKSYRTDDVMTTPMEPPA